MKSLLIATCCAALVGTSSVALAQFITGGPETTVSGAPEPSVKTKQTRKSGAKRSAGRGGESKTGMSK